MKRENRPIVGLVAYILCILLIAAVRDCFDVETSAYRVLKYIDIVLGIILCAAILAYIVVLYVCLIRDKKIMKKAIADREYDSAIEIFEKKSEKYFLGRLIINAKYYLLNLYFLSGQNDKGLQLLYSSSWWTYSKDVLYFKILIELKNEDYVQAEKYFNQLSKRKYYAEQIRICQRIFDCIQRNNFEDKFYLDSKYPIVKEIYDLYNMKVQNKG